MGTKTVSKHFGVLSLLPCAPWSGPEPSQVPRGEVACHLQIQLVENLDDLSKCAYSDQEKGHHLLPPFQASAHGMCMYRLRRLPTPSPSPCPFVLSGLMLENATQFTEESDGLVHT